jgi:TonB family protein
VSLSANVLERLRREMGKSVAHSSSGGLLLGNRSPGTDLLFIADCFPIALRSPGSSSGQESGPANAKLLKQALNLWRPGSRTALYAVGQYSVSLGSARETANLIECDGLSQGDIFLKLSGKAAATSAAFYVMDADGRSGPEPDLMLPFDSLVATDDPPEQDEEFRQPVDTPAEPVSLGPRPDPKPHVPAAGTDWRRLWPAWIIAGLLVTIGGLLFQQFRTTKLLKHQKQTTELRLEPVRTGSQWELRWDKNAPAVRAANRAQLTVSDGSRFTQLDLDASEIQHGYVLYTPESSDVTFRLDMYDRSGRALTESVRALANVSGDETTVENRFREPRRAGMGQDSSAPARSAETRTKDLLRSARAVSRSDDEARLGASIAARAGQSADRISPPEGVPPTAGSAAGRSTRLSPAVPTPSSKRNSERGSGAASAPSAREADAGVVPRLPPPVPPRTWSAALAATETPAYIPPQPLQKPAPVFRKVGVLSYSATDVDIIVHVGQDGRVSNARLASESGFVSRSLAAAALDAARRWTFEAARSHGNKIESDYKIVFRFVPPSQ